MRGKRRWVGLLVALALVGAACGGGNDNKSTATSGQTASTNLAGQEVEVAATWSGAEQANFAKVLDLFHRKTGATTRFTSTGDDIATVLGTRIQGGAPPDVAFLPQPGLLNDLAARNALKPVEAVAGKLVDQNYPAGWRQLGSVNGTLYGVWFKAANKSTVWYRPKAFQDAGVQPPQDWEGLKKVAGTIADSGVTPFAVGGGDGWPLTDWFENVYLRTAGPENYDKLAKHQIPWTDPSVKKALTTLADIFGKPQWLAGGVNGVLATTFDRSVSQVFAQPPQAAILYEGDFVANNILKDTTAKLGVDAKIFDFPAIAGSPPAVVGGGDVAVLLKDTPAGRELIRFLATPEAAEPWAEAGGFTSPNKNLDPARYANDINRRSAQSLTEAQTFRFDLSDLVPAAFGATAGQGEWKILQDYVRNPSNVDGITQQLEAAAAAAKP
jgi:alpha-glucoside transport system substrate-binding protein